MRSLTLLLSFCLFSAVSYSQVRYWVSDTSAAWSSLNWSATSGGVPDLGGPPASGDSAVFDAGGTGNCMLDGSPTILSMEITSGYTGTIQLGSNSMILVGSGNSILAGGSITGTAGVANLSITTAGNVTFSGTNVGVDCDVSADIVYLNGSTFDGTLSTTNNGGTGTINSTGGNIFNGTTTITNASAADYRMAVTNPDVFNGTTDIVNASSGSMSLAYSSTGNQFNGLLNITNDGVGVSIGAGGTSTSTLSSGNAISVAALTGDIAIAGLTQLGSTEQTIFVEVSCILTISNSSFQGKVDFTAPDIYSENTIYSDTAIFVKTGTAGNSWVGGNTFQSVVYITNDGQGNLTLGASTGDSFQGEVNFIKNGTGEIYPASNSVSSFGGDINIDYPGGQLLFGQSANGRVLMNGSQPQSVNDLGVSANPVMRDLQLDNANGVTLNIPVEVSTELDLDQGELNTDATNLLFLYDDAIVSSVSDASYVAGPVQKIGDDAFEFPVGDQGVYLPISISAPATASSAFQAEYHNTNPAPFYDDTQIGVGISHISDCEYWTVDRIVGSDNVSVSLFFKPHNGACSGVNDPSTLDVVRWDGFQWVSHGNGGTTGTTTNGSISTSGAITAFSPFTFANTTGAGSNPLKVELISWKALATDDGVNLEWATASENNNDYFRILKSEDGIRFVDFTTVDGMGTSNSVSRYSAFDPQPRSGWNYYRLVQVDHDGTTSNHGLRKVYYEGELSVTMYPNPSRGNLFVRNEAGQPIRIEVIDASGNTVLSEAISGNWSFNGALASGVYSVRFITETQTTVQKLVVQ